LEAYLDRENNLHLDAQDLGHGTEMVSSDGEYEYFKTIAAHDLPALLDLLDAPTGSDVLDFLGATWTGASSYDLEERIRLSDLRVNLSTWAG
jgi:fermentation-respiration switch protein FrsA (DUF1100 family)